ncbi:MAG: GNAT family N-acetyltransferase [Leptospiraceae bacterium]|nr:GNAT family N-acetyltransferase [Leptospiraceae bacterium]
MIEIDEELRNEAIFILNQFFKQVNSYKSDGLFKVKPRASTKLVDLFLKLKESKKVFFYGIINEKKQILSMLIAKVEERPFLEEEKIVYLEYAITRKGFEKLGLMKKLLAELEKWTKKKSIAVIELRALSENVEAVSFWKKQNYTDFYVRFRKRI